ncbi:unnamed protein product [Thlaspi arvense]|uniref:DCD domain-containing protein n=1 Tax=Thlaspi arvense TaxID=13288 RepID=A0AAU9T0N8_THLAR|nr:unnamed protein product [Thlaspi arvense]
MSQWRGKFSCRNLTKSQLGGVVFGCTKHTFKECISKQLFGLPYNHMSYVQRIDIGLPLFLFNYSDRKLHGIFEAAGPGQLYIDPYAWTSNGSERTSYPAQVQISLRLQCEPLSEEKFKPTIEDNYYSSHHFWFELDHLQTNKLKCLLTSFAVKPNPPVSTSHNRQLFHFAPSSETKENADESKLSRHEPLDVLEVSLGSGRESDSSAAASHPHISEYHPDVQNSKQKDKDCILEKLKNLTLSHEHQDNSLMKNVDQANIPTCKNLEDRGPLEEEICSEFNGDGSPLVSSPRQPTISQLMNEVKELRAYRIEYSTKVCYLEEKLEVIISVKMILCHFQSGVPLVAIFSLFLKPDEAHKEIHRLRAHCNMLESLSSPLIAKDGGSDMEIFSPDDSSLDSTEAILLLGGFDGYSESALSSVMSYFPSRNVVKAHSSMSCIRSNASVAKLDGKIYVFGGEVGGHGWSNTVESYSETDGRWSVCPPLNQRKGSLGGATLDGKVFAIGGGNEGEYYSDVEMLDPDIGRWIRTRSMEKKRFAVASSEHNGSIYAVGGFDEKEYLNSAERFDPREHSWMRIASMKTRRGCHSLVVLNEKLYAIGGYDGSRMVASVEIYDPRTGTWIDGEAMKESRGYSAAVVVKDSIYVIGGYKGEEGVDFLDTVECFKEGQGWKNVSCSSMGRRGFLSAVPL